MKSLRCENCMSLWTLKIFEYFSALVVTFLEGFSGFTVRTVLFLSAIAHSLRSSYLSVWRTERNVRTYGLNIGTLSNDDGDAKDNA